MYEIWEDRLVTRDGDNADAANHRAVVYGDGHINLRIDGTVGALLVSVEETLDGTATVPLKDVIAALADLRTLKGMNDELASDVAAAQERAAEIVERVCEELAKGASPYRETLATDLRTIVLGLLA